MHLPPEVRIMRDLESLIPKVWNRDVRPFVEEAYRCYATGAIRACIALTWVAVCFDLIEKLRRLAEDGEASLASFVTKIEKVSNPVANKSAINVMQDLERELLEIANSVELIDSHAKRQLERLREDRNLSVHPSLKPMGEYFEPQPDYARAHLCCALDSLLIRPPSQGRIIIERFQQYVLDAAFRDDFEYMCHIFFDAVMKAARKQITRLAAKHSMLEIEAPDPADTLILADRMARCLHNFARRDQELVQESIEVVGQRFGGVSTATQLRTVGRLGSLDVFWSAIDEPIKTRLEQMISDIPKPSYMEAITADQAAVLSLVAVQRLRLAIPTLESKFDNLPPHQKRSVIAYRPSAYFAPYAARLLADVRSYRSAEEMAVGVLLPCARYMALEDLGLTLENWAENDQCRYASEMVSLSVKLYQSTAHLRGKDQSLWEEFIEKLHAKQPDEDSHYRYDQLVSLVRS
jgi:hypothetical protein